MLARMILSAACLFAVASVPALAADPQIVADAVYGHKDGMALTYDVIKPEKPSGAAILWIQSGGWYSNWTEPKAMASASKPYLDKGFTMFIVRHASASTHGPITHTVPPGRAMRHAFSTKRRGLVTGRATSTLPRERATRASPPVSSDRRRRR